MTTTMRAAGAQTLAKVRTLRRTAPRSTSRQAASDSPWARCVGGVFAVATTLVGPLASWTCPVDHGEQAAPTTCGLDPRAARSLVLRSQGATQWSGCQSGPVITAAGLADALTSGVAELLPGSDRPILGLEMAEPDDGLLLEPGDLVVLVGARTEREVLGVVDRAASASGLVLRRRWLSDDVRTRCAEACLPVLVVADDSPWSWVVSLLRTAVDRPAALTSQRSVDVYGDLFEMADTVSGILQAPVTIEDATSRVLAYSTGQDDVDEARTSTIVGRQVPREVRSHFRSLGVFRRLATSDEPFFVPEGAGGIRARYVVPVRAGGEWLGSVWAVVDEPVPAPRLGELSAAAQVIALYLLRLRSQSELHRQVQVDHVRTLLHGTASEHPTWLDDGPWRVVVLHGPSDMAPESRCELWQVLARRHGWRRPLIADLDDEVYGVVRAEGSGPGSWSWLSALVVDEWGSNPGAGLAAGAPVSLVTALSVSRAQAEEVARVGGARPVATVETQWAAVVLARALAGMGEASPVSPVAALAGERPGGSLLVDTLEAVIDHWGEPQRAAAALAVHPNTIRYRMARLQERCEIDLHDPQQRLAVRLEIASLRARRSGRAASR